MHPELQKRIDKKRVAVVFEEDEQAILIDPVKVNEALLDLGCEVKLWWTATPYVSRSGRHRIRQVLAKGRFRLGQQKGDVPIPVLEPSVYRERWRRSPTGRACARTAKRASRRRSPSRRDRRAC